MELNELKNDWAELEVTNPAKPADLSATLKQGPKRLRRLKLKLGIEAALLTLLFLVFHDWFDGHLRPLQLNIVLGAVLALGIANNIAVYRSIDLQLGSSDLRASLERLNRLFQGQAWLASTVIVAINLLLLSFLTLNVFLTPGKMAIAGMWAASAFFGGWLTHRSWRARSREARDSLAELDANAGTD